MFLLCKQDFMTMVCYGYNPIEKNYFTEGNEYFVFKIKDGYYTLNTNYDDTYELEESLVEEYFYTRDQLLELYIEHDNTQ